MGEAPFDVEKAQRWFAVEFNNRAWDLVELAARSDEQVEEMIHAAHAARIHWLAVGKLINHARAQCLLATAYAVAGLGEAAVRHAERCLKLCEAAGDEVTTFDRATAFGCASRAYACDAHTERAREFYRRAADVAAGMDADDREVFEKLYRTLDLYDQPR